MRRHLLWLIAAAGCHEIAVLTPGDAGVDDAGTADAGVDTQDAGFPDAGVGDAGFFDAGPPPPPDCDVTFDTIEHVCEGDEDVCEPIGDLSRASYDVLATWSRVEGDTLVLQFLTRGQPFYCRNTFSIGFICPISSEQFSLHSSLDSVLVDQIVFLRHATLQPLSLYVMLPPEPLFLTPNNEPIAGDAWFARDHHLSEVRISVPALELPCGIEDAEYRLVNDSSLGDEGVDLGGPSRGGQIDLEPGDQPRPDSPCVIRESAGCGLP